MTHIKLFENFNSKSIFDINDYADLNIYLDDIILNLDNNDYYSEEQYEYENTNFRTYEEWLENYWVETMKLCYWVLKKGGKMCYILSGYGSDNIHDSYDLLGDMNHIAKIQFGSSPKIFAMKNKNANMTKHRETDEKIVIFNV